MRSISSALSAPDFTISKQASMTGWITTPDGYGL